MCGDKGTTQQQLLDYVISCIQPGSAYFHQSKFGAQGELHQLVMCFKAACLLSPLKMKNMQPTTTMVDRLAVFPIFDEPTRLHNLKAELPVYVAAVEDVFPEVNVVHWWKRHELALPHFAEAFQTVVLVHPSSAAVE